MPKCVNSWKDSLFGLFHFRLYKPRGTDTAELDERSDVLRNEAASSSCKASQWLLSMSLLSSVI